MFGIHAESPERAAANARIERAILLTWAVNHFLLLTREREFERLYTLSNWFGTSHRPVCGCGVSPTNIGVRGVKIGGV
jgi:hypothetical protein